MMAITELIFGAPKKAQIGVMQFDASLSETHTDSAEIAEHPIEQGSVVSDHIIKQPEEIEINGIVTNTPLVFLPSLFAESPLTSDSGPINDRVEAAYAYLRKTQKEGSLVTVITSLRTYENMAITSISVSRDATNGNVLNASVSLREIILAKTKGIPLPIPKVVANQDKKNKGKKEQNASTEKQSEKATSLFASLAK